MLMTVSCCRNGHSANQSSLALLADSISATVQSCALFAACKWRILCLKLCQLSFTMLHLLCTRVSHTYTHETSELKQAYFVLTINESMPLSLCQMYMFWKLADLNTCSISWTHCFMLVYMAGRTAKLRPKPGRFASLTHILHCDFLKQVA